MQTGHNELLHPSPDEQTPRQFLDQDAWQRRSLKLLYFAEVVGLNSSYLNSLRLASYGYYLDQP
jgi:hypothetical protein